MSREFEPYQRIERSIITKYKKESGIHSLMPFEITI